MYNPPGIQSLAPRQFFAESVKGLIESLLAVLAWRAERL